MALTVGQRASKTATLGDAEVQAFAEVTGDFNPVHFDDAVAAAGIFGRRVVHGMLAASHFSGLLANELPGAGTIYLSQTLSFKRPIFVGDTVEISVEVLETLTERRRVRLATRVTTADGQLALEGEALVLAPASCFE